ncbi:MAG: SPOR domain-containing protein [Roseibium sp.]
MSEDYDTKRSDLTGTPKDAGGERLAVEDPLIELARIVHKNKPSGADVGSGRVGSTDYFADLDDFAGASARPQQNPSESFDEGRVEPAFGKPAFPVDPSDQQQSEADVFSATDRAFEPVQVYDTPQRNVEPAVPADLEDELIGALRRSVDTPPEGIKEPQFGQLDSIGRFPATDLDEPIHANAGSFGSSPVSVSDPLAPSSSFEVRADKAVQQSEPVDQIGSQFGSIAASEIDRNDVVEGSVDKPSPDAATKSAFGTVQASIDSELSSPRPAIDEDDLFAAINPALSSDTAAAGTSNAAGHSAGIDAIFADLDFPDPAQRRHTGTEEPTEVETEELSARSEPADDIDNMSWPAAADAVPEAVEDDNPPPPEGYDLDAVARAMQESDPSLKGSGVLPPHPAAEKAAIPMAKERSRRGIFVAAGVIGVAVLGATGFFLIDNSAVSIPDGPPPIISGLQEPLKVFPDEAPKVNDDQSAKLIYDRVDGTAEGGPDRLVSPETPEPASLPPAPAAEPNGAELVPGAPKRVRTLVVRPDGTIISEDNTPSGSAVSTAPANSDSPKIVTTTPVIPGAVPEPAIPAITAPVVADPPAQAVPTPAIVTDNQQTTPPAVAPLPVPTQAVAPVPTVLPRAKPAAPVRVAQVSAPAPVRQGNDRPLNLAQPVAAAPATASPAVPAAANSSSGSIASGTYIVQVTSQRSAAAASDAYSGLQRRFPEILGSRNAVIVSADLGDRGVFYRARIPTGSRDEANRLCEQLQGAGGDCFVRRAP